MFSGSNVLTLVIALLAVAATWGGVLWRVGRLDKDLETTAAKVDEKMKDFQKARERQGERIGDLEGEVARLEERSGMPPAARKRRQTKPAGEDIG